MKADEQLFFFFPIASYLLHFSNTEMFEQDSKGTGQSQLLYCVYSLYKR